MIAALHALSQLVNPGARTLASDDTDRGQKATIVWDLNFLCLTNCICFVSPGQLLDRRHGQSSFVHLFICVLFWGDRKEIGPGVCTDHC